MYVGADAALEVAVAGDHGAGNQAIVVDRLGDLLVERSGVTDAGGAADSDEIESELVEILLQVGLLEVGADDLAARRQRGLHPRLLGEALLDGVAGEQTGADEHARIRRVGAAGDRRDHDVAVAEVPILAFDLDALLHLAGLLVLALERGGETGADLFKRDAAFRTLRAGHRGHDFAEVERERVGADGIGGGCRAEHVLRLGVLLHQGKVAVVAAGHLQVVQRLAIDGEEAAGRAILRRHVADGRAIGQRHVVEAGAVELDELVDHALLAQHLRHGQHDVGRGDALARLAGEVEADDVGDHHRLRLAEHGGFSLDAANAPGEYGEAVDHCGVAVGADARVRDRRRPSRRSGCR